MAEHTPHLTDLAQTLELRWRLLLLVDRLVDALCVTLGASVVLLLAQVLFGWSLPLARVLLLTNGAALVAAIVLVAVKRRDPSRFLIDADREYGLKSLLVSGYEFGTKREGSPAGDGSRESFEQLVVANAQRRSEDVDPHRVYPGGPPRRIGVAAALFVALGIFLILNASGWFDRPEPPYLQEALQLEDAGRRLAERAEENEELTELADEIRRLSEQVRGEEIDPDRARRRIDQLNQRIEDQIRNLERLPPMEYNEEAEIPPETEDTVRRALRSGMSAGEVEELFTRMRSEGNTVPDIVDALEEATPDRAPNANLDVD